MKANRRVAASQVESLPLVEGHGDSDDWALGGTECGIAPGRFHSTLREDLESQREETRDPG